MDVELRAITNDHSDFPAHWHEDIQLIATVSGTGSATVDRTTFALGAGSVLVIPPHVAHTAHASGAGEWTFHSLHIDPARLSIDLSRICVVLAGPGTAAADRFAEVIAELFERHSRASLLNAFGRLVLALNAECRAKVSEAPGDGGSRLAAVRDELEGELAHSGSIRDVAARAGMSEGYLSRSFRDRYGLPPHAWRLIARVERSKAALRGGATVADARLAGGFGCSAAFSRCFKRFTGITPRAYRAWILG